MSYKHFNSIINKELEVEFEDATERGIFLQSAFWADNRGILRMSQGEVAEETLYSLATIKRIFNQLEGRGYLSRLGHGRYQIISPTEVPNDNILKNKFRRWIKQKDNEALKAGYLNIIEEEIEQQPDIFHEAIRRGWLKKGERQGYIAGCNEDGSQKINYVLSYNINC